MGPISSLSRRSWFRLAAGAAAATAPGLAAAQPAAIPLTIAGARVASSLPAVYAFRTGIFRKHGLDVTFPSVGSGAAILAATLGGSVDIGSGNAFSFVTAFAHGAPLKIVAYSQIYTSPDLVGALLVAKDAPFRTASDLNGKTIGSPIAKGDIGSTSVLAWLDQNGGDSSSVKIVEVPYSAQVAALAGGRIVAASTVSPNTQISLASGDVRVFGNIFDAVGKRFCIGAWFATDSWIAQHGEALTRFRAALREANASLATHAADATAMLAAYTDVAPAVIASAPTPHFTDDLDPRDVQPVIDVALRYKLIDKPIDARNMLR